MNKNEFDNNVYQPGAVDVDSGVFGFESIADDWGYYGYEFESESKGR